MFLASSQKLFVVSEIDQIFRSQFHEQVERTKLLKITTQFHADTFSFFEKRQLIQDIKVIIKCDNNCLLYYLNFYFYFFCPMFY